MSKKVIFVASGNDHKIKEFQAIANLSFPDQFLFKKAKAPDHSIIENGKNYLENCNIKLDAYAQSSELPLIADDSGLEILPLDRQPGLLSARFLGENQTFHQRFLFIADQLKNLQFEQKKAEFVCTIGYFDGIKKIFTEGRCQGLIQETPQGDYGFGYDPIFFLKSHNKTMAELKPEEKNKISHRSTALIKLFKELPWTKKQ